MINLRVNQPTNTNFKAAIKPNKVLVESAETVLKNAKPVTAALALATIVPASIKQKENDVEMISEDFIKNRKGKSLTEEEIQVYKDKWNYLSENKSLSEDNKIVAHSLCQNPKRCNCRCTTSPVDVASARSWVCRQETIYNTCHSGRKQCSARACLC